MKTSAWGLANLTIRLQPLPSRGTTTRLWDLPVFEFLHKVGDPKTRTWGSRRIRGKDPRREGGRRGKSQHRYANEAGV